MAWTNKTNLWTAQDVSSVEVFSSAVTLNPGELAHVEVEGNFPGSPTDNLVVSIYSTLDDTSENWDDVAIFSQEIDNGTDPSKISIPISGLYKFRVGIKANGATDTIAVTGDYRKDGVSV